jgi:hypothetical protein
MVKNGKKWQNWENWPVALEFTRQIFPKSLKT